MLFPLATIPHAPPSTTPEIASILGAVGFLLLDQNWTRTRWFWGLLYVSPLK